MKRCMHTSNAAAPRRAAIRAATLAVAFAIAALPAAAQAPGRAGVLEARGEALLAALHSPHAKNTLENCSTFRLSNGVPVVVRRNSANRVQHVELVIRGGSLAASPRTAGWEGLALRTMARGSEEYGYEEIRDLLDETSSAISVETVFEYSSYKLTTLDKYFDRLFPVWIDTFVNPSFEEEDFDQVLSEAKLALQSKEQNPWNKTALVMNEEFFKDHPYARTPEGTKASLEGANLGSVKALHARVLSPSLLFVVAVGDFDPAGLAAKLEKGLSTLPVTAFPEPAPAPAFPVGGKEPSRLVKHEFPQSRGIGYLRGDFAAPGPESPEFMPLNLGMKMLADLLFNVVRDKYGATYSPSAYIRAFGANYGSVAIYRTNVTGKVKAYIDEAVSAIASGKVVSVDPTVSEGAEPRMSVEAALPVYKAQYVNELYESQQTNAAIAKRIAESVVTTGDYRSYLLDVDRIQAATSEQVMAAVRKYLLEGALTWVALGSNDQLLPVVGSDYESFELK